MQVCKPQTCQHCMTWIVCCMTLRAATLGRRTCSTSSQHIWQLSLRAARHQHWALRPPGGPAAGLGAAAVPESRAPALVSIHHQQVSCRARLLPTTPIPPEHDAALVMGPRITLGNPRSTTHVTSHRINVLAGAVQLLPRRLPAPVVEPLHAVRLWPLR